MKKILVLVASIPKSKREDNWQGFASEVREHLDSDKFNLELWAISELGFLADGVNSKIWKRETGQDLKEFDLIVIREAGKNKEFARSIAWYAKLNNIPLIDRVWQKSFSGSKLSYSFLRAVNEIASPPTLAATSGVKLLNTYTKLKALQGDQFKFDFPLVIKAIDARKGNFNFLVKSKEDLREILSRGEHKNIFFILQPFIQNIGDWRILVIGGKVELGIFRSGDKSKTHLNNSSKGAETKLKLPEEIPQEIIGLAKKTSVKEKLSVAGVDIVEDRKSGEIFVLESNPSPQIQSGSFVNEKIEAYTKGLMRIAEREAGRTKLKANNKPEDYTIIGRREKVGVKEVKQTMNAKVDSGAYYCSLHVHSLEESDSKLKVEFDGGEERTFESYRKILVSPSSGNKEWRYVVPLNVEIAGVEIEEDISLTSRSGMRYKFLIGRRLMRKGKFLVNPAKSYYFGRHQKVVVTEEKEEDN